MRIANTIPEWRFGAHGAAHRGHTPAGASVVAALAGGTRVRGQVPSRPRRACDPRCATPHPLLAYSPWAGAARGVGDP